MQIRRLSYALGAEITGVDLRMPISNETFQEIHKAFLEHCVLLFRNQPLTREQHIAFSRLFGELDDNKMKSSYKKVEGMPQISLVINKPKPNGEAATGAFTGQDWHSDRSHLPLAAAASILRCVEVPNVGGDTMFANMYLAYEQLSDGMKKLLEGLYGVHLDHPPDYDLSTPERAAESRRKNPAAAQPVVQVHPETGRKALYLNEEVRHFVGMTRHESLPLIEYLTRTAVRPQNVYRHHWRKDDLLMWDNRCLLHIALGDFDRAKVRHMERTTVNGNLAGYVYEGPIE